MSGCQKLPGELVHLGVAGVGMCIASPAVAAIVGVGAAVGLAVWLASSDSSDDKKESRTGK